MPVVTIEEAEKLVIKALDEYVSACGCSTEEDIANVLMKMASMSGISMCAFVGQREAGERMYKVAKYVATSADGRGLGVYR